MSVFFIECGPTLGFIHTGCNKCGWFVLTLLGPDQIALD